MFLLPSRKPAGWTVVAILLAGCAGQPTRSSDPSVAGYPAATAQDTSHAASIGEQAAIIALRQLGVPYRYGGSSPSGFDCSGLVHYAYAAAGKPVPRTTSELWRQTRPIGRDELETGDLLFFRIEGKGRHVGLYLGDQRFVHAPATGRDVTLANLESAFYRRTFIRGGRPL